MTGQSERVHFSDGNRLTLADLVAEQSFHLGQMRRHQLAAHAWGIFSGLDVLIDPGGGLAVTPGYAVDGYGRPLLLDDSVAVPPDAFLDRDTDQLDLHLVYASRQERAGAIPVCGGADGDRTVERPFLRLSLPDLSRRPRWRPPGVAASDLDHGAEDPGVSAEQAWPVYLGRVRYTPEEDPQFIVDSGGRRYGGLRAERIVAAAGTSALDLGHAEDGTARLTYSARVDGADRNLLAIRADGDAHMDATLTVTGDITLNEGALGFTAPQGAAPDLMPASLSLGEGATENGAATTDLRVVLPDAPPGLGRFVVGAWSDNANTFRPILTVANDGEVSLAGNLTQLPQGGDPNQPKSQPGFDAAAEQVIQAAMFNAISGTGSAIVNAIVSGGAVGPLAPENLGLSGAQLANVVASILPEALVGDFAQQLQAEAPSLASTLREALDDAGGGGIG